MRVLIVDDQRTIDAAFKRLNEKIDVTFLCLARNIADAKDLISRNQLFDVWMLDNDLGNKEEGIYFLQDMINFFPLLVPEKVLCISSNMERKEQMEDLFAQWCKHGRPDNGCLIPLGG